MAKSPIVLIIGCGIAGPVLALLLKKKGYQPIVFEKVHELGDAGASLMLFPNGLKVLNLVGLAMQIIPTTWPLEQFRDFDAMGELLGGSDIPGDFEKNYTQPGAGVMRAALNSTLQETLSANGIEYRQGWGLEGLSKGQDGITAHFNKCRTVSGAFVVGCDGIKSKSREIVLREHGIREEAPLYTGLSQTAGLSATPLTLQGTSTMRNWFGSGIHVISYPVSRTHTAWAISQREAEQGKETWRLYSKDEMAAIIAELLPKLQDFDPAVVELVTSAQRLTKYGLFDRSQLDPKHWYWSRCVLVGDAAHPTSPHLGQGANQALEDCYHLSHNLPDLRNCVGSLTEQALLEVFTAYAEKRQPRTAKLVVGARAQGELRVCSNSAHDVLRRNSIVAASWRDSARLAAKYDMLCREPF